MTNPALGTLLPFLLGWLACRDSLARPGRVAYRAVDKRRQRWKRVALATGVVMIGEIDGDHNRTRLQLRSTERSARLSTRRESLLRP